MYAADTWLSEVPNGEADIPPAKPEATYNVRTFMHDG